MGTRLRGPASSRPTRCDRFEEHAVSAPLSGELRWAELARRRMRADWLRVSGSAEDMGPEYRSLLDEYDRAGLPFERVLTRLSYARWLSDSSAEESQAVLSTALELA